MRNEWQNGHNVFYHWLADINHFSGSTMEKKRVFTLVLLDVFSKTQNFMSTFTLLQNDYFDFIQSRIYRDFSLPYMVKFMPYTEIYKTGVEMLLHAVHVKQFFYPSHIKIDYSYINVF